MTFKLSLLQKDGGSHGHANGMNDLKLETIFRAFPWVKDTPMLRPDDFEWHEYNGDNSFLGNWNDKQEVVLPDGWVVLGWCDANRIVVRPRDNALVVKFQDGDDVFWMHIL